VGVCATDRVAGGHPRGAVCRQPVGQRAQPSGLGGVDRPRDRPGRPARRARVRARRHRLLADGELRPVGPASRLRLRQGQHRGAALPRPRPSTRRRGTASSAARATRR
jgi:hypothetical protein